MTTKHTHNWFVFAEPVDCWAFNRLFVRAAAWVGRRKLAPPPVPSWTPTDDGAARPPSLNRWICSPQVLRFSQQEPPSLPGHYRHYFHRLHRHGRLLCRCSEPPPPPSFSAAVGGLRSASVSARSSPLGLRPAREITTTIESSIPTLNRSWESPLKNPPSHDFLSFLAQ